MRAAARTRDNLSRFPPPGIFCMVAGLASLTLASAADAPHRPNIVIILGDDMGYADMGSFGSEIHTPNLDSLARDGVRFTNFYTHASCSPTRSILLSGVDTHVNGLGNMDEWTSPNQRGVDGYEGYLNNRVVTLPQLLTTTRFTFEGTLTETAKSITLSQSVRRREGLASWCAPATGRCPC